MRQMQASGLNYRRAGNGDGRTRSVALTDLGANLLKKGTPMARENNAVMEARLGKRGRKDLIRLLRTTHAGEDASPARI